MDKKKWKRLFTTIGNLFIDLGKLMFASLILGTVLKGGIDLFQLFMFGASTTILLFVAGVWFVVIRAEGV